MLWALGRRAYETLTNPLIYDSETAPEHFNETDRDSLTFTAGVGLRELSAGHAAEAERCTTVGQFCSFITH
jgi:hypothetical protein